MPSDRAHRRATKPRYPAAPTRRAVKPGLFAPRAARQLHRALLTEDTAAIERIRSSHPTLATAAAALLGVMLANRGEHDAARESLESVFTSGTDPAADPFVSKHAAVTCSITFAEGIRAELAVSRHAIGLALADSYLRDDRVDDAIEIVEQLEPSTYRALALAEMYCDVEDWPEVVRITEKVTNEDDPTAMLCVFRGIAFREQGLNEAARQSFKEALRTKKRDPAVRHRALLERARTHEREGKRAMARKDLERIMAEDSNYEGLEQALAELY